MGYVESGYVQVGYVEGIETITPSDKVLSIPYSFVLDGADITDYILDADITRENGKAFSVLSLKLSGYTILTSYIRNRDIRLVVTLGSTVYSFILFDVDSDYKDVSDIIAKTQGCLLDYPFAVKKTESFAGSANEIIENLMGEISSYNGLPDFVFNEGAFLLDGSPLEGIEKLISVSGGTMYEVDNHLVLTPHLKISETIPKFIFNDDILLTKDHSDNNSGSLLVNKVIFNAQDADLLSEPLITMVSSDDGSRPYFLLNPAPLNISSVSSNLGTMTLTYLEQTYIDDISTNYVMVSGGILSIKAIIFNGVPVNESEYEFLEGYNVILFTTPKYGVLSVTYITKAISVYTKNGTYDRLSSSLLYQVQYINQELNASIFRSSKSTTQDTELNGTDGLSGNSVELVGNGITLDSPTQFDVMGTINSIAFISNPSGNQDTVNGYYTYGNFDTTFITGISIESGLSVNKTFNSIFEDVSENISGVSSGAFGFFVSPDITISEVMVGSLILNLTKYTGNSLYDIYYIKDEKYLGLRATITYEATVDRYTIPAVGIDNAVKNIQFFYDGGLREFSYPNSTDPEDEETTDGSYGGICTIPADLLIDVASLIEVSPEKIAGQSVTYDGNSYTISSNGTTTIHADSQISYVIDTNHLRKGSYITVDTLNAEVA